MSTIDFKSPRDTNKIIANYIARKSGKDFKAIIKLFDAKKFTTNEGLVEVFNKTIGMPVSIQKTEYVPSSNHVSDVSYKTQEIINSKLLDDAIRTDDKSPDLVYLDHGCGSGKITSEIANVLQATKVYGVDIYVHPLLSERSIEGIVPDDQGIIPLSDDSVDVVTCLLSLHHVILQQKTLTELYRVLRPGGTLLIYEHDFITDRGFRLFLDAVHMTFSLYGTENEAEGASTDANNGEAKKLTLESEQWIFDTHYKSKDLWRGDLENCGFRHVVDRTFKNSQRMYFAKFKK